MFPLGKCSTEFDYSAVNGDNGVETMRQAMGGMNHDVSTPRLTHKNGALNTEMVKNLFQITADGFKVIAVIGLIALSVASKIDGETGITPFSECGANSVPHTGIGSQTVDQDTKWLIRALGSALNTSKRPTVTDGQSNVLGVRERKAFQRN
jgi:hypothetical protein